MLGQIEADAATWREIPVHCAASPIRLWQGNFYDDARANNNATLVRGRGHTYFFRILAFKALVVCRNAFSPFTKIATAPSCPHTITIGRKGVFIDIASIGAVLKRC